MLNENLSKLRKERGLTQEALAVKLNVVRQTISKWENGTAVPDADTLCKIADALEVSVAELLGSPVVEEKMDMTAIAKSLAEINEQLAIRNRKNSNVLKVICGIIIGIFLIVAILIILNISVRTPITSDTSVSEETNVSNPIELDKNGVPLWSEISQDKESNLRELFTSTDISKDQIVQSWGKPIKESQNKLSWMISSDKVFTVFFTDANYAYDCGIESR